MLRAQGRFSGFGDQWVLSLGYIGVWGFMKRSSDDPGETDAGILAPDTTQRRTN